MSSRSVGWSSAGTGGRTNSKVSECIVAPPARPAPIRHRARPGGSTASAPVQPTSMTRQRADYGMTTRWRVLLVGRNLGRSRESVEAAEMIGSGRISLLPLQFAVPVPEFFNRRRLERRIIGNHGVRCPCSECRSGNVGQTGFCRTLSESIPADIVPAFHFQQINILVLRQVLRLRPIRHGPHDPDVSNSASLRTLTF